MSNAQRSSSDTDEEDRGDRLVTIVAAMVANLVITIAKLVMAGLSGSSAMLAEAVHSCIDTVNQALMVVGVRRSKRPPDRRHPFGYGQEVYFWTMIYAGLMFAIGGGVSIYEGIQGIRDPELPTSYLGSYIVLAVAFVAEGISWTIAMREVAERDPGRSLIDKLLGSKAPSRFVVVGEDGAALLGVAVAALGLGLTQATGSPVYDAVASLVVGALLGATAVYLTFQTRRLLVGQAADVELRERIEDVAAARDDVIDVGEAFTLHVGPHAILVAVDVRFREGLRTADVARAIDGIEDGIRNEDARIDRIFVEPQLRTEDLESPMDGTANVDGGAT